MSDMCFPLGPRRLSGELYQCLLVIHKKMGILVYRTILVTGLFGCWQNKTEMKKELTLLLQYSTIVTYTDRPYLADPCLHAV